MNSEADRGFAFLKDEQYVEALACLLPLAEHGDARCQAAVGMMYQMGVGLERNIPLAIKWLSAAAEKGIGEAAHNLGTLFLTCEPDFPISQEKSRYWYAKAKELGFVVGTEEWYPEN